VYATTPSHLGRVHGCPSVHQCCGHVQVTVLGGSEQGRYSPSLDLKHHTTHPIQPSSRLSRERCVGQHEPRARQRPPESLETHQRPATHALHPRCHCWQPRSRGSRRRSARCAVAGNSQVITKGGAGRGRGAYRRATQRVCEHVYECVCARTEKQRSPLLPWATPQQPAGDQQHPPCPCDWQETGASPHHSGPATNITTPKHKDKRQKCDARADGCTSRTTAGTSHSHHGRPRALRGQSGR
jgi:hypothetical protein